MSSTAVFGMGHVAMGAQILALIAIMLVSQPMASEGLPRWDETNYATAFDPINRRGRNPAYATTPVRAAVQRAALGSLPEDSGAGNGGFHLTVPIVRLPGRGLDLELNLHYNSRLWHRAGNKITYNIDDGWPAPGWSLGFGRLIWPGRFVTNEEAMLVDPEGTRYRLKKAGFIDSGAYKTWSGKTTDGTFIAAGYQTYMGQFDRAWITYPNGMRVEFGAPATSEKGLEIFPTRITDANGNVITITYRLNSQNVPIGPHLDTVTDTLGRTIRFYYNADLFLTAITGPDLQGGTQERTLLRLNYDTNPKLKYAFAAPLTPQVEDSDRDAKKITALYSPATASGYWFGDPFSYSTYGMLAKVEEQRGMSFRSASLNEEGEIKSGIMTRQRQYDYPLFPDPNQPPLMDAPTYRTMTESWHAMDTDNAVTKYDVHQNAPPPRIEVTAPNGTRTVQRSYNAPGEFKDGLPQVVEIISANNTQLRATTFSWEESPSGVPRLTRTDVLDELNQQTATEYSYDPNQGDYNQVTEVREYDYGGQSVLRSVRTEYETAIEYVQRHIYNLPKVVEVYQDYIGLLPRLASRIEYTYDGQPLTATPGIVQHREEWNPASSAYLPLTAFRGNVTQTTRYADAAGRGGAITEHRRYDLAGNVVTVSGAACCEQTSYTYTAATQYAYPSAVTRGAADPSSLARVTTKATYHLPTGLVSSSTDTNGRTTTFAYNPTTLRLQTVTWSTEASTTVEYDDTALKVTETTRDKFGALGTQTISWLNGLGLVFRTQRLGESGNWDVVETQYDQLGRFWKQSRPFREGDVSAGGYTFVREEGHVYSGLQPGAVPLTLFWHPGRGDNFTTATAEGEAAARGAGYAFIREEGYVYPSSQPGTVPLKLFWHPGRGDNFTTTTAEGEAAARGAGYLFVREEGYVYLSPRPGTVPLTLFWSPGYEDNKTTTGPGQQDYDRPRPVQQSEITYDGLGRVTMQRAPDGSAARTFYNESTRPSAARVQPGQTARVIDAWGRERWTQTNALGHLVQVVEPNPSGSGSVSDPDAIRTVYQYNPFGQVLEVLQGPPPHQVRTFAYDSLGRLTQQRLPEKNKTLNNAGVYGGPGVSWSDVFTYDARSNVTSYTDARGVKTVYDYDNDPLNRLKTPTYDTSGVGDTAHPIVPAPSVRYEYMPTGDVTRLFRVTTTGVSTEEYAYDTEGYRSVKTLTLTTRPAYPLVIGYLHDSLNRLWTMEYPAQYGMAGAPRASVHADYDVASRLKGLARGGVSYASQITYNAAGQMTSRTVGAPGPHQLTEGYVFDGVVGLLRQQRVRRADNTLLDLTYDYLQPERPRGPGPVAATPRGQTGQLTKVIDNLDGQHSRAYAYDALGRLVKVTFGPSDNPWRDPAGWMQEYGYDAYGNRTQVKAFGPPWLPCPAPCTPRGTELPPSSRDGLDALRYDTTTNRITTPGFAYDAAGNLTRTQRADGTWQRYQYDTAGRLSVVTDDAGGTLEVNTYGANRQRLVREHGDRRMSYVATYYVWSGDQVLAEYTETLASPNVLQWTKSYVSLGSRILATVTPGGTGELVQYHHPGRLGARLITHATDTTVTVQHPFSFGVESEAVPAGGNTRRFTSYDRSVVTGLDYAVNRYYDPQQGRFMQVDPLEMAATNLAHPQSLNLYAYVRNDPVNATDPLGLDECIGGFIEIDGRQVICGPEVVVEGTPTGGSAIEPGNPSNDLRFLRRGGGPEGTDGGRDAGEEPQQPRCRKSYASLFPPDLRPPGPLGFHSEVEAFVAGWFLLPAAVVGAVKGGLVVTATGGWRIWRIIAELTRAARVSETSLPPRLPVEQIIRQARPPGVQPPIGGPGPGCL